MKFNINDMVRVKLTEHGRNMLKKNHEEFWKKYGVTKTLAYYPPLEDAEGWSEWQMWNLMEEFGPHIGISRKNCFDLEIDIVVE